jgi:DNA mismatch endonuclease (patch repair protein)
MAAQRRRDTTPELLVRRRLHALGLRYRVAYRPDGRRFSIDIAFTRWRVAVFSDGCFWHGCRTHGTLPKSNSAWWRAKLQANIERDERVSADLTAAGWRVVRAWEHEDPERTVRRVLKALARTRGRSGS